MGKQSAALQQLAYARSCGRISLLMCTRCALSHGEVWAAVTFQLHLESLWLVQLLYERVYVSGGASLPHLVPCLSLTV